MLLNFLIYCAGIIEKDIVKFTIAVLYSLILYAYIKKQYKEK
ncbi:HD phosphohydrolase family protein [Peptoniphilus indolicus ATCC 29427]|uniref:HD phosphohydrolase family protein n=1 Tax=Peptoniphilus indolicus ATCC 29427 TaxID=997350 RepID=G4D1A8_9FIRM|nr:HD phosphohydrolase family protein [Peptoniphilus indolicus ATCC 29427]